MGSVHGNHVLAMYTDTHTINLISLLFLTLVAFMPIYMSCLIIAS